MLNGHVRFLGAGWLLLFVSASVEAQSGRDAALDSARFARLLSLSEMPAGTRLLAESSPDSTTYVRIFQVGAVGITLALRVLESPDSLRDYVAAMSPGPAASDSVFRLVTQQRQIAIDSQETSAVDVEVSPGTIRSAVRTRAWSPHGPLVYVQMVIPGAQAALLVNVTGVSDVEDALALFRAVVAASVARLDEGRPRQHPRPR